MDAIQIDRLTLKLSGLSESQGRHLALLVTQGLAGASIKNSVASGLPAINVDLTASRAETLGLLSERVVAEVLRQIERSS